jgi:hypothetical protein
MLECAADNRQFQQIARRAFRFTRCDRSEKHTCRLPPMAAFLAMAAAYAWLAHAEARSAGSYKMTR